MFVKKTVLTTLCVIGMSLPLLAKAGDLMIDNDTNQPSTSIINDGFCSSKILGNDGITPKKTQKPIYDWQIRLACMLNLENCKADVYMTDNCTGDLITTVVFSATTGIKSATPPTHGYVISYDGFKVKLSGGPALAAKK